MKFNGTSRVGILSDTHAHLCPRVLDVMRECDVAVHAGDIGDTQILDDLLSATGRLVAVCGNNDLLLEWGADASGVPGPLPDTLSLDLPGGVLAIEHGHRHGWQQPDHDGIRAAHPEARAVVYGHTHWQVIDDSEAPWVINPGAAGHVRNHGGPSCLVLTASNRSWDIEVLKFPDQ